MTRIREAQPSNMPQIWHIDCTPLIGHTPKELTVQTWREILKNTLWTGTITTLTSSAAIAGCGLVELGNAAAPINAVSHILWGDEAASVDEVDGQHTLAGLGLNSGAMFLWAGVFEALLGKQVTQRRPAISLIGGLALAALAYVVDYYLVPERFTPGFEKRLSGTSMLAIYAALGVSLGLGRLLLQPKEE